MERWHPVTYDMGLIDGGVEDTVGELMAWHSSIGMEYVRREIASSFGDALETLPPLSAEKRRRLFVPTKSGWTACFQSGIQGSDPFPAMSMLAQRLKVLSMRVCSSPPGARWPSTIWEVYAPEDLGGERPIGYRRSIAASNDGGRWVFHESGLRFPFEKPEFYTLPRVRDRFTHDLLCEYVGHFGLAPFSDEFYDISPGCPAVLLENCARWVNPPPEFALKEVVAGLPWRRSQ